jgi:hypothetical protein
MKKWVLIVVGVLFFAVLLLYVLIPSTLTVARIGGLRCRSVSAWRFVSDEARWGAWWPDGAARRDFYIQRLSYHVVHIGIRDPRGELSSTLSLLPVGSQDSSLLQWNAQLHCGWSPVDRIRQYLRASRLKDVMDRVLLQASVFSEKRENLYGVDIRVGTLPDTLLIATRMEMMGVPTTKDIYAQLDKLSHYAAEKHSRPTNYPMANFSPDESRPGVYKLLTAIPVDARLEGGGDLFFMRLIPWKYLIGDVKGGPAAVAVAFSGMETYIRDYQITVMATPFQMLVTDRRQEPDSTRWVTRIYYPIF